MSAINITHTDLDGIISAALVRRGLKRKTEVIFSGPREISKTLSSLVGEAPRGVEIYITDIGVNDDELDEIVSSLERLRDSGCKVKWLDHHSWSERALKEVREVVEDLIVRRVSAACEVVADYFGLRDPETESLLIICSDADTASYEMEQTRYYDCALKVTKHLAERLIDEFSSGRVLIEDVLEIGRTCWEEVASRMDNPFYDGVYAVLLFAVLTHAFIGVRNVLFEFITPRVGRVVTSWTLFIIYVIILLLGIAEIVASAP